MTVRFHLFPFRTQKLSSLVPKIVSWKRLVKIGSRRLEQKALRWKSRGFFVVSGDAGMPNIKQNLDSIIVVGFTIYDGKERPPAGTGPEGSPELHWQGGGWASRCTTAATFWVSVWATLPATE